MNRSTALLLRFGMLSLLMLVSLWFRSSSVHATPNSPYERMSKVPLGGMKPGVAGQLHVQPNATNMTWHGGAIMPGVVNVYAIFWEPQGLFVDPRYNGLIAQYYTDVGGNRLYNINKQYRGSNGTPSSAVLRGVWLDNTQADAYPAGTILTPYNILAEVGRAMQVNGWRPSINNYFSVYTSATAGTSTPFCAYHNYYLVNRYQAIVFAHNVYPDGNYKACQIPGGISPNNCLVCDSTISISAHEQFEAATDPLGSGWFYQNTAGEIGDLCANNYGQLGFDNGQANQQWNNHFYIIQMMWNNGKSSCQQGP